MRLEHLFNFYSNVISLFESLFIVPSIVWSAKSKRKKECNIHKNAKVHGAYSLNKVKVGFGTYISNNSVISYTEIGKFCSIGPNFFCGWGVHPIDGISTSPAFYSTSKQNGFSFCQNNLFEERKPIIIGNDVFIGANVTVLDGVCIGDGAVIGAGAVVSKNIPPYAVAVGSPIKIIKYRFTPEVIQRLLEIKWWDHSESTYEKVKKHFFDINKFLNDVEEISNIKEENIS